MVTVMKVLFLGHFSSFKFAEVGASPAGDFVQRGIIDSLNSLPHLELKSISQRPSRAWPNGAFYLKGCCDGYGFYPFIFNLPLVREVAFALQCLFFLIKFRPEKIVQYNSYFFLNILVVLYSLFFRADSIIILQDYRTGNFFSISQRIHDFLAGIFVRFYSLTIPVTKDLGCRLKIDVDRIYVFPGAMEHEVPVRIKTEKNEKINKVVLFAGALEDYNGISRLLKIWSEMPKFLVLHIYGGGSKLSLVRDFAEIHCNIIYGGYTTKNEVHKKMAHSDFNVCFRFSEGLDDRFFFPSKFFSVNCYQGFVLINKFSNIPEEYDSCEFMVRDDFSNLSEILQADKNLLDKVTICRQDLLFDKFNWRTLFERVFN